MQIIRLEGSENIDMIRDLLEAATDSVVLLVVPRGCEALERSQVHLTVLRRWADSLALRVALVIEDAATHVIARDVGLIVLPSVEAAQQANLAALDRKRRRHEGLPPAPYTSLFRRAPDQVSGKDTAGAGGKAGLLGGGGKHPHLLLMGMALGALLLAFFLIPTATITLQPATEPMTASMEITGEAGLTAVNYGLGQVPARTVSVEREGSDSIGTTDKRDVPDGHAEGSAVFANKTTIPVTITKGTLVRTSFGKNVRFFTVADVLLPAELHGTVRVGILAELPGPDGNVPALTVNVVEGELAAQAEVLNDTRTTGGTVRRMAVVHGDDKVQLRAKLMKRLQEEAYKELIAALSRGDFIPTESLVITVLEEEFDHQVGDQVDTLGCRMKVTVNGLAVSGAGGEELLLSLLQQRMKPGYRLVEGSAQFGRGSVLAATTEEARFQMSVRASIAAAIEPAAVQKALAGKTAQEAKSYLSRQFELAADPKIELFASLFGRLPWLGSRIRLRIQSG